MKDRLTVTIFTVERQLGPIEGDSVRVPVSDNSKGGFSGCYGIRKGHARAVISLKKGELLVSENGKAVFTAEISDGFATIESNDVRITVADAKEAEI